MFNKAFFELGGDKQVSNFVSTLQNVSDYLNEMKPNNEGFQTSTICLNKERVRNCPSRNQKKGAIGILVKY